MILRGRALAFLLAGCCLASTAGGLSLGRFASQSRSFPSSSRDPQQRQQQQQRQRPQQLPFLPVSGLLRLSNTDGGESTGDGLSDQQKQQQKHQQQLADNLSGSDGTLSIISSSSSSSTSSTSSTGSGIANSNISNNDSIANNDSEDSTLPTYRKLAVFITTTILIWLSEPLLSLVDMTIVSMTSKSAAESIVQIAALGPATTLYDSAIYLTYFLAIATTNQLAPKLANQKWKELRQNTSHIMGLAFLSGLAVTVVVCGFGQIVLRPMMGSLTDPKLLALAYKYCWIRGLVAPIGVMAMIAQAFCLTCLDTKTPALAVIISSVVNIIGDWILSPKYGIAGASLATALATLASAGVLLRQVASKTSEWKEAQYMQEGRVTASSGPGTGVVSRVVQGNIQIVPKLSAEDQKKMDNITNASSSNNNDNNQDDKNIKDGIDNQAKKGRAKTNERRLRKRKPTPNSTELITSASGIIPPEKNIPFASMPDRKSLVDLFQLAGPVFFVMIAKVACFSILTIQATNFGLVPLAAHNILMRVFVFFACFGDSLGQAAQSFFPSVAPKERRTLSQRLFFIATFMGITNAMFATGILKYCIGFLTPDLSIHKLLGSNVLFVAMGVCLHPIILLMEGIVLAKRDLVFLLGMYGVTSVIHGTMVFSPVITYTIEHVWRTLFTFQVIRIVQFGWRLWRNPSKKKQAAAAVVAPS